MAHSGFVSQATMRRMTATVYGIELANMVMYYCQFKVDLCRGIRQGVSNPVAFAREASYTTPTHMADRYETLIGMLAELTSGTMNASDIPLDLWDIIRDSFLEKWIADEEQDPSLTEEEPWTDLAMVYFADYHRFEPDLWDPENWANSIYAPYQILTHILAETRVGGRCVTLNPCNWFNYDWHLQEDIMDLDDEPSNPVPFVAVVDLATDPVMEA